MKLIDVTMPITPGHWRFPAVFKAFKSTRAGDFTNVREYTLRSHQFTHIDAPLHFCPDGKSLDSFPLEQMIGPAAVLDVTEQAAADSPIDEFALRQAYLRCRKADILLIKSGWDRICDWNSKEYWEHAPYITENGAAWLAAQRPKIVGFDFPQDHDIRFLQQRGIQNCHMPTHELVLARDILMIEYLCNLWQVSADNVQFIGLPLKLEGADGAQIRCVCVWDDDPDG